MILLGDDSGPEPAGGELRDGERVGAGEQRRDDPVAHRVDVEQRQRREHPVVGGELERAAIAAAMRRK